MTENFFIIDGHSQLYQAYYAITELTTPSGQPINAVYGFTRMLRKIIREDKPCYMAVAFDTKGPTFRHTEYKNGQKKSEIYYKDGKYDGKWTLWYANGYKKWEGNYKDGVLTPYF